MSKLLTNQISNYNDNGPVEVKDGVNIPTGKPFQVAGATGTSGDYLKSTGSSVAWTTFPTIPAAQVNSDWNATSGVAQISNKPTLATVATSGSYNDLTNKPSVPAAQIQSDWNQASTGALDFIKNKPTLFDGAYTSLTGAPSVPATLNDLADVSVTTPVDQQYLKWESSSSRWVQGTGTQGLVNLVDDTTPQLGGTLDANSNKIDMGTNEITDAKVGDWNTAHGWGNHAAQGYLTTYTNTTYSQQAIQDSANVKLRLTDSAGVQDDITITAGTNLSFTAVGANGFTINSTASGGGGATVTTDDVAPGSPTDGDLWWKSNEGRLKVFYQDADGSQWIDASPPLAPTNITFNNSNKIVVSGTGSQVTGALVTDNISLGGDCIPDTDNTWDLGSSSYRLAQVHTTTLTTTGQFTYGGHILPASNAQFDIGSAEYKVRHLFLSDNTLYFQGSFLKVAQHDVGGSAQSASYLIPLSKLKDALNASGDYEAFKTAILAITDA